MFQLTNERAQIGDLEMTVDELYLLRPDAVRIPGDCVHLTQIDDLLFCSDGRTQRGAENLRLDVDALISDVGLGADLAAMRAQAAEAEPAELAIEIVESAVDAENTIMTAMADDLVDRGLVAADIRLAWMAGRQ